MRLLFRLNKEGRKVTSLGLLLRMRAAVFPADFSKMTDQKASAKDEVIARPRIRGVDLLRDPLLNKGMAFNLKERQLLGIHGLLPPRVMDQEEQAVVIMENFNRWENDLDRYIYLMALQDRNEKLFYRVVGDHTEQMMPIIYTPTVGAACLKYGLIFRKPRGLYISIHDRGHVYDVMCNWPVDDVKAIVVTDGERILGLGDLGCYGMGIPVGKLSLYTALAGIQPHQCLPILLDVGTNNENLLKDPLYTGLRMRRQNGSDYDDFIDEFMSAVVRRFGRDVLVQFEDFGNHNAFRFLEKYRHDFCTFNDDIQGTAAVAVAGILASTKITKKQLKDNKFVFQGAGEASLGIAHLLLMAMKDQGIPEEEGKKKIWLVDSKGLIVKNRPSGGVTGHKVLFAQDHKPVDSLSEVIKTVKPSAIIGAAAVAGAFTEDILKFMGEINDKPIIFALSNPTSKAECTAEQAYTATQGRCVFASGSPFQPVTIKGKTLIPGQGNNAYIFPGLALAIIVGDIRKVTEEIFLESAELLAEMVTKEQLDQGRVYPPLSEIREVSTKLAVGITEFAYKNNLALKYPEPEDKDKTIRAHQYITGYESFVPEMYDWPGQKSSNL